MNKKLVNIFIVLLVSIFIFVMSSMSSNNSNSKSKSLINNLININIKIGNKLGISNISLDRKERKIIIDKLNKPIRKCAHATEYFIFTLFIIFTLDSFKVSKNKIFIIALSICFIYSLTDEFHQLFIDGRTGQFIDCLIDTFGGLIACIIMNIKFNKREKNIKINSI